MDDVARLLAAAGISFPRYVAFGNPAHRLLRGRTEAGEPAAPILAAVSAEPVAPPFVEAIAAPTAGSPEPAWSPDPAPAFTPPPAGEPAGLAEPWFRILEEAGLALPVEPSARPREALASAARLREPIGPPTNTLARLAGGGARDWSAPDEEEFIAPVTTVVTLAAARGSAVALAVAEQPGSSTHDRLRTMPVPHAADGGTRARLGAG